MRVDDYCWAVISTSKPHPTAQAVLWAIAKHVNRHNGETFVSQTTIAKHVGISWRQVQRVVAELAGAGVFVIEHRPGRSSIFRFPLSTATTLVAGDPRHPRQDHPRHPAYQPTTPVSSTHDTGVVLTASNREEPRLRARPRPELVESGLYDDAHWNVS